jgi:hypothetical protein
MTPQVDFGLPPAGATTYSLSQEFMATSPLKRDDPADSREAFITMTGELLLLTQHFEMLLEKSLKIVFSDWDELSSESLFKKDKRSLGRVLSDFRSVVAIDSDIDVWLGKLVEERNFFAHHLSRQDGFDAETFEGRSAAWAFYATYYERLERATLLFSAIIYQKGKEQRIIIPNEDHHTEFIKVLEQFIPETNKLKRR